MKILLVGNYEIDRQESMQRFAIMLANGLSQLGHEVRLIRPVPFFGKARPSARGLGKWLGYIDKFLLFPKQLQHAVDWADVVHICDHANAVYAKYLQRKPHVVTCNDLLAIRSALGEMPQNPTRWTGKLLQHAILKGLKRSQHIACISHQTKSDLLRIAQVNPQATSVVYMGLNYPYKPMSRDEAMEHLHKLGVSGKMPFILHVGGNYWYKNRIGVLQIFRHLSDLPGFSGHYLMMAGQPFSVEMHQFAIAQKLHKRVIELVDISNEDLQALYSKAVALLFPSLQEGFGWPIIEAQACGCPVFTSNRPPMTEVGGEAAIYINPECPEEAAREIERNMHNADSMRRAGFANAENFTAEKMLLSYCQLYAAIRIQSLWVER